MRIIMRGMILTGLFAMQMSLANAAPRMTSFNPVKHGFKFDNTFKNNFISAVDIRTGGLCGGMVYSAFDYFNAGKPIPIQDYRPADHTALHQYLYRREVNSLVSNVDKWAEVGFNPGGARNKEFFNWGLKGYGGGRIQELRRFIDKNRPVPLGLETADSSTGRHQVLAIGYDMGRYKGDLKAYKEDFKIFVYDPNHHNVIRTLIPDTVHKYYTYKEDRSKHWRTYFVDTKYAAKRPPAVRWARYPMDNKIHELVMELGTGNDDLRGGKDNLNVTVEFTNGQRQVFRNVNGSRRWISNYSQFIGLPLSHAVAASQIRNIKFDTTFGGGIGGDNWDLNYINIRGLGGNVDIASMYKRQGHPVFRFTGNRKEYAVRFVTNVAGKTNKLTLKIRTGNDDLRGGNDNLDVTVLLRNGHRQVVRNVNHGARWADRTTHEVSIPLDVPVSPTAIRSVMLAATVRGGMGGDNWNMDSLVIYARGGGVDRTLYNKSGSPLVRITGKHKTYMAYIR